MKNPSDVVPSIHNVLVIDDDSIDRALVIRSLSEQSSEFNYYEAATGKEALEMLQSIKPICIFLDLRLPDVDGLELLKVIKSTYDEIPIVIYTAHGDERLAADVLKAGATDYLSKKEIVPTAIVHSLQNAIRLESLETQKKNYIKNLEKLNKDLDSFVYIVSHDLRAPLRAISNLSQWVEEDLGQTIPEVASKNFSLMRGRVKRMESMIDGLLDYSRIGKNSFSEQSEEVDINDSIKGAIKTLVIPKDFQIDFANDFPTIKADKKRIDQIFFHLISNAITHNHRLNGKILISWSDENKFYKFVVSDDGPGIDKANHERIFKVFETLASRDDKEAVGLGLPIVKKIIELFGGSLIIDSELGKGSTFSFSLPKLIQDL